MSRARLALYSKDRKTFVEAVMPESYYKHSTLAVNDWLEEQTGDIANLYDAHIVGVEVIGGYVERDNSGEIVKAKDELIVVAQRWADFLQADFVVVGRPTFKNCPGRLRDVIPENRMRDLWSERGLLREFFTPAKTTELFSTATAYTIKD